MKKIFMIAFVATATLFAACNSKTDNAATNADETKVEATTEEVKEEVKSEGGSTLDKYADLVEKIIPLQEKAQKGDAAAIKELTDLSQEVANMATELQKEMATMTPEQTARFTELAKKLMDAAPKAQ